MAAFSRGCSLTLRSRFLMPRLSGPRKPSRTANPDPVSSRLFSCPSCCLAAKPVKSAKRPPPSKSSMRVPHSTSPIIPPPQATYRSFAEKLALKPSPTLLYQAPSHTLYVVGSYAFGLFCLSYAGFNFYAHYLHPPPGLSPWIPVAFGGVCFAMTCAGTWLILGPSRLVRTILAVPSRSSPPTLSIQVTLRRPLPLPFIRPHTLTTTPSSLTLSSPLSSPAQPPSSPQHPSASRLAREQAQEFERTHLLSAPFRHASYALWRLLQTLGRVWTRDGFVKVFVRSSEGGRVRTLKLDVSGGWALDGGRGIERLVKVKAM